MKIYFISLGCDKNLVDSEKMLGFLKNAGHEITDDETEAEVAVINTCCFIHDAKTESIETILETAELKKTAKLKYLIVIGCLAERYRDDILAEIDEVDAVLGTTAYDELVNVIDSLCKKSLERKPVIKAADHVPALKGKRLRADINHYSYLKIAEGCNKRCTYCVIPDIKGRYRSEDFDKLVAEATELAESGVNELMVIAQETTLYGTDLYGKKRLPELLKRLAQIEGIEWIRLMYCYPEEITDELIDVFVNEPKMRHYIDMPIQHASDAVLKRMGRRTSYKEITDIIKRLRKAVPDIAIRTSLITGFPGETAEDHELLKKFISEYKLERVGVFTYSREENTPAYKMKDQILKKTKDARRKELMLIQQKLVFEKNRKLLGKSMKVIVDGRLPEDGIYVARSYMDAPGIDGCIFVKSNRDIISGSIIDVKVEEISDYDLIATEVDV